MNRFGRYTAALAMTAVGVLLLLDHEGTVDAMAVLRVWWPVLLVAFGVELLIVQGFFRKEGTRVRPAIGAMFGAAVLCGFMLVATQGNEFRLSWLQKWTDGASWGLFDSASAAFSIDKGVYTLPVSDRNKGVVISTFNGRVQLRQGPVQDIEVKTMLYVNADNKNKADEVARQSSVQLRDGERREIIAVAQSYGVGKLRKPRMDLTVTFPVGQVPPVEVIVGNGDIDVHQMTGSGTITLDLKNGHITGDQIGGSVRAKILNGDIKLAQLSGMTTVETINGDIGLQDVRLGVSAKTVNGDIEVRSPVIGGAWNVSSTMGDLKLAWPDGTGVKVKATTGFGDIQSEWPLNAGKGETSGTLGDGMWDITAHTKADVSLLRFQP